MTTQKNDITELVHQVFEFLDSILLCAGDREHVQSQVVAMVNNAPVLPNVDSWEQRADQLDTLSKINLLLVLMSAKAGLPLSEAMALQLDIYLEANQNINNITASEIRNLVLPENVTPMEFEK